MSVNIRTLVIFVIGISASVKVRFFGELYGSDILLFVICLWLSRTSNTLLSQDGDRNLRNVFIALALWLFGLVISDVVNNSALDDLIRGWARVIFFGTDLFGILLIVRWELKNLRTLLYGWAASYAIVGLFPSVGSVADNPWKFTFAPAFSLFMLLLATKASVRHRLGPIGQVTPLVIIGVFLLYNDVRSGFLVYVSAALFAWLKLWLERAPEFRRKLTPVAFVAMALVGGAAAATSSTVYGDLARSGYLGDAAKEKYVEQSQSELGLFLAGRSEILIASKAIIDSPIIGYGSWARNMEIVSQYVDTLIEAGLPVDIDRYYKGTVGNKAGVIPSHSHLFGSWLEAGILGAGFWIFALIMSVKALYEMLKVKFPACCLVSPIIFFAIWDFLFSPFGGDHRFVAAIELSTVLLTLNECALITRSMRK